MSKIGSLSPLAAPLGSGTSHAEDVYTALRSAVGTGASPADGLDDLWRQSRAIGKAASQQSVDRAAFQSLPSAATDHLAVYERILGLASSHAEDEEQRRQRVTAAWTKQIDASPRGVEADLQDIDANFTVFALDHDKTDSGLHGRVYPPRGTESTRGVTQYPNFSTEFVVTAVYAVPVGLTEIPDTVLDDAERLLNSTLPAWVDFVISQEGASGAGFYADGGPDGTSVADLTAIYD